MIGRDPQLLNFRWKSYILPAQTFALESAGSLSTYENPEPFAFVDFSHSFRTKDKPKTVN